MEIWTALKEIVDIVAESALPAFIYAFELEEYGYDYFDSLVNV